MASGWKNGPGGSSWRRPDFRTSAISGPKIGFLVATLTGFAAWGVSRATLPTDAVMPVVATLFLAFAVLLGLLAWRFRDMDSTDVTYADAAGALTLIGFFAAVTIDPDQLVRLVESQPRD